MADQIATQTINIETILGLVTGNDAVSDIHLAGEESIALRINGDIQRYEQAGKINSEMMEIILKQLMRGDPKMFDKFMGDKDADFAYIGKDGTAYRVNAFLRVGKIGVVMRKINGRIRPLEDLMFKDIADGIKNNILSQKK